MPLPKEVADRSWYRSEEVNQLRREIEKRLLDSRASAYMHLRQGNIQEATAMAGAIEAYEQVKMLLAQPPLKEADDGEG